jgi:hypothetical protein
MPGPYSTIISCLVALQYATRSLGTPLQVVDPVPIAIDPPISITPKGFHLFPITAPLNSTDNDTTSCSGCVLQAEARITLSYPFEVEHVTTTINVVPYITVFPNSTVTSWSTITPNATGFFNATTSSPPSPKLSTSLTWTWNGVPLYVPSVNV